MATMQPRKSLTLNLDGLGDDDEDDDLFFETRERMSSVAPIDLEASSSDEDDFEESRMSFSSNTSPKKSDRVKPFPLAFNALSSDYDMWMTAPGSITERRKRLLLGMGLNENREFLRITSMALDHAISKKFEIEIDQTDCSPSTPTTSTSKPSPCPSPPHSSSSPTVSSKPEENQPRKSRKPSIIPFVLGRSRSEGDITSFSMPRNRKEEFIGKISKQRLTRTSSDMTICRGGGGSSCPHQDEFRVSTKVNGRRRQGSKMTSVKSKCGLGAFFLIKNLDTGREFIVNESREDGMWNRLSDLQTGKKLTMEEFEQHLGFSPIVKELMSREKVARSTSDCLGFERKLTTHHSYFSRSLRKSKRTGAALLKNIKGVVASGFIGEREKDETQLSNSEQRPVAVAATTKNEQWVRVRQSGKSMKELSALHLCQEFQAHEGCIWTIKFSHDGHYMASSGEDRVIHVWEVQELEVTSMKTEEGSLTPIHPSLLRSPERNGKKGRHGSKRGSNFTIPDYVHIPETVFSFSEKPHCSFHGHSDEVLDLSWSRSQLLLSSSMDKTVRLWDMESKGCLKVFTHNDFVTCVQFNPMDEDYFISGCLDAKVRIWNIPQRFVVDWIDTHEMVTAISYTPDAQAAFVGTHKGGCRVYRLEDGKASQMSTVELRRKKKSHLRKVTGFQFSPTNPSEVLVTSADSRIRIVEDSRIVHKFVGFRNANSQISGSFSPNGRYVISASEDSQVYVWKNEGHAKARNMILTQSHEQFQCRDVSVAIPWPRTIKGDPPVGPAPHHHSKRHSKHFSAAHASGSSSCGSPLHHHVYNNNKGTVLPPLIPKKKNNHIHNNHGSDTTSPPATSRTMSGINGAVSIGHSGSKSRWSPFSRNKSGNNGDHSVMVEEDGPGAICRTSSGLGDSFSSSDSASMRFDDSPSISASARSSSSGSWSMQYDNGHTNSNSHASAWGLVIVTAGYGGEVRCYQNFGLPRKV